jgi:hypothetical protein
MSLTFNLRRSDHVTDALIYLRWPRLPDGTRFKIEVLAYGSIRGTAPSYLANFQCFWSPRTTYDLPTHRASTFHVLAVPLGYTDTHATPVAGAEIWNSLPSDITCARPIPSDFRHRLETFLFNF